MVRPHAAVVFFVAAEKIASDRLQSVVLCATLYRKGAFCPHPGGNGPSKNRTEAKKKMASDRQPKERARKKKKSSAGGILQGAAAAAAAAGAAAAAKSSKHRAAVIILAVVLFALGAAGGFFGLRYLTRDDGFSMVGEDFVEIQMYAPYEEPGATGIFFGKEAQVKTEYYYREDISHDAVKVNGVDTAVNGFYYAVYTCDGFPYRGIELIRTIEVMRVEDDGEIE